MLTTKVWVRVPSIRNQVILKYDTFLLFTERPTLVKENTGFDRRTLNFTSRDELIVLYVVIVTILGPVREVANCLSSKVF